MRYPLSLLLIILMQTTAWATVGFNALEHRTVSTELLRVEANNTQNYFTAYTQLSAGGSSYFQTMATMTVNGSKVNFYNLTGDGYTALFKATGGPTLKATGLDMSFFIVGTNSYNNNPVPFMCFNAFLVIMISFRWMGIMGEVSKGKGGLEITPLIVKLCMGLMVCYNMPLVYSLAMQLKDVGMWVVISTMLGNSTVANNVSQADGADMSSLGARDAAVKEALADQLGLFLFPITDVPPNASGTTPPAGTSTPEVNSGRQRLANLVVQLNKAIDDFNKFNVVTNADAVKTSSGATAVTGSVPSNPTILYHVGCASASDTFTNPFSTTPQPMSQGSSGDEDAATILKDVCDNTAAANYLKNFYVRRLWDFIHAQSYTYDSGGGGSAITVAATPASFTDAATAICTLTGNSFFYGSASSNWGSKNLGSDANMSMADATLHGTNSNETPEEYKVAVEAAAGAWLVNSYFSQYSNAASPPTDIPDQYKATDPTATSSPGFFSRIWHKVKDAASVLSPASLFKYLGNWAMDIVRWMWVPTLAKLANFLFNFTIECYVYLLFLAYPLWFYKKTEKAFSGAMDTLISMAFTAMTFSLLCLMLDAFMGSCLGYIIAATGVAGGAAGGAVALQAVLAGATAASGGTLAVIGAGIGVGILAGLMFGWAIFYVVGTGMCLLLAPKIFKAFKEGSSVVAPLLMGAASAMTAAVVGSFLMGGATTKLGGKMAGSNTGQAMMKSPGTMMKNVATAMSRRDKTGQSAMGAAFRGITAGGKTIGKNIGRSVKSDWNDSIKPKLREIASDPKGGFVRLMGSAAGRSMVSAFAAISGDPMNVLKAMGAQSFTENMINRGAKQGASNPAKSSIMNAVKNAPVDIVDSSPGPTTPPAAPTRPASGPTTPPPAPPTSGPILGPDGKPARKG